MQRTTLILVLLVFLLFPFAPALAGGSAYSRYGIGDILSLSSTRTYALGGASIGLVGDGFINRLNPAGMSKILYTRFSGSYGMTNFSSKSEEGNSRYGVGGFQGIALAFPVDSSLGIVLSLEALPFSSVRYGIQRSDTQAVAASNQTFYGDGGLSTLAAGLSLSITKDLHAGGKLTYYYGRTRQYAAINFVSSSLPAVDLDRSSYYSGFGFTGGVILEHAGDLLGIRPLSPLTLGAIVTTPVNMDLDEQDTYSSLDTTVSVRGTFRMPLSYGIGFSFPLGERSMILGDLIAQQWADASRMGSAIPELRNSVRIGIGCELHPPPNAETYWQRTIYRAGAYYHASYLQLKGHGIDEYGLTAGLGLPIGPDAKLNLGIQLGQRGTTSGGLQQDTILRFSVGISASEIWFLRLEED